MSNTRYQDEHVTLYQGDSLAVLRELPSDSVDGVLTDPPYSSGGAFRGDRMQTTVTKYVNSDRHAHFVDFTGDNRDQRSFGYWSALWLGECLRVTKPGGVLMVFIDWRQLPTMTDMVQAGGWVWRGIVPWNKTEASRPQRGRFRSQCEYVVWGSKGPRPNEGECLPGFTEVEACDEFDASHVTQRSSGGDLRGIHPSEKPAAVADFFLRILPKGGTVLDPFAGSGVFLSQARMRGLSAIGVELSDHYCAEIVRLLGHNQKVLF